MIGVHSNHEREAFDEVDLPWGLGDLCRRAESGVKRVQDAVGALLE